MAGAEAVAEAAVAEGMAVEEEVLGTFLTASTVQGTVPEPEVVVVVAAAEAVAAATVREDT
jgi:hypothetical protein